MKCFSYKEFMFMSDKELKNITLLNLAHQNLNNKHLNKLFIKKINKCLNLELLFMQFNNFTKLPKRIFKGLNKLQVLHLQHNNIEYFNRGVFSDLINMKRLYLMNNNIKKIYKNVFSKLINIQKIFLCSNKIKNIYLILPKSNNLELLDLSFNKMKTFKVLNLNQNCLIGLLYNLL